ncbi:MAG: pirin family protein, partial [Stellaceae bacterium]
GADGVLRPGDVQWMTAGRGVLHSELPHGTERAHTLQLWLNLPAAAKLTPARYVDQPRASVPVRRAPGAEVRVYAGRSGEIVQRHGSHWPMMLLDIKVEQGHGFAAEIPGSYRAFLYLLDGAARIGAQSRLVRAPEVAWFEPAAPDDDDTITIAAEAPCRALLYGGPPIDEPVVAYGPFVMNSANEIRAAIADYRAGRLTG